MAFPAKYPGVCTECGETFDVDTLIVDTGPHTVRTFGHAQCPVPPPPRPTCPRCFTEIPLTGVCGVC